MTPWCHMGDPVSFSQWRQSTPPEGTPLGHFAPPWLKRGSCSGRLAQPLAEEFAAPAVVVGDALRILPRLVHITYGEAANVDVWLGPPIALPRQAGRLLCADAGPVSIRPDCFRVGPHARPPIQRMVQRRMSPRRTDRKGRARVCAVNPSVRMHRVDRQRDGARSGPLRPGTRCPHRSIPRSSTRLG